MVALPAQDDFFIYILGELANRGQALGLCDAPHKRNVFAGFVLRVPVVNFKVVRDYPLVVCALPIIFAAMKVPPRVALENLHCSRHGRRIPDAGLAMQMFLELIAGRRVRVAKRVANNVSWLNAFL